MRTTYTILIEKPEQKRPLGRPRHRWEGNIAINLKDIRYEDVDSINLSQAFLKTVMKPPVTQKRIIF
jgi:hypothetical protein